MQLTALIDVNQLARPAESDIPCRAYDAELWFAESPADVELAKSLCGACPVRKACLASALSRQEPWGVWGGELFVHGAIVARKRPRGRPRQNAVAADTGPCSRGRRSFADGGARGKRVPPTRVCRQQSRR